MQQGTIFWPNLFSTFEARCWKLESAYRGNFDHVLLLPQLPKPVHAHAFCVNFSLLARVDKYRKHSFQLAKLYLTTSYCQTETNVAGDTKEGPDSFILAVFVKLA